MVQGATVSAIRSSPVSDLVQQRVQRDRGLGGLPGEQERQPGEKHTSPDHSRRPTRTKISARAPWAAANAA